MTLDNNYYDISYSNNECYICNEENAFLVTCECKNLYLHDKCLLESIIKLNNPKCTICKREYKNILNNTKTKIILESSGKEFICRIFFITTSISITILEFIVYFNNFNDNYESTFRQKNCININYKNCKYIKIIVTVIFYTFLFISIILFIEFLYFISILYKNNIPLYSFITINYPVIDKYYICNNNFNV